MQPVPEDGKRCQFPCNLVRQSSSAAAPIVGTKRPRLLEAPSEARLVPGAGTEVIAEVAAGEHLLHKSDGVALDRPRASEREVGSLGERILVAFRRGDDRDRDSDSA